MPDYVLYYYKFVNLLINFFVKSKSIPVNPLSELRIDTSRPIIYVLLYQSQVDLLTLRTQCIQHNLPDPLQSIVVDGITLLRYVFIYRISKESPYYILKEKSVQLFHNYLDLHRKIPELDMQLIPAFIIFGRRPDREKKTINQISSLLLKKVQKFFSVIRFGRDTWVYFSHSVSLHCMAKKYGTDNKIAKKLARVARMHFTRRYLASVGPPLPLLRNLFTKLLASKAISHAIKDEVRSKKISYIQAQKNAVRLMKEVSANVSYKMICLTDRLLGFTWNCLYQGINVYNVERIHQLTYNGYKIVYIPCHRSHMDYLLISYVLYHQGLVPPHIAAGVNLNFWPIGPIFRRLGAFFIRRIFTGNKLYSIIFREYLAELFIRGYSIEYFIEGRRSRTGRLLFPKTGTLSMTIQSILRGNIKKIALVPIYIGYEHIVESGTYVKELQGKTKKKENLLQIFRGLIKLRNLGQSYVSFGKPLQLITWLNQHVPDWKNSIGLIEDRPPWLISTVNNIATDLMIRINNASAANAINLCCTALLSSYHSPLTYKQLTEQLECYLNLMRNVPYSKEFTIPSESATELINQMFKMNKVKFVKNRMGDVIILPCDQEIALGYYRNNIFHILVLPLLVSTIIFYHNHITRQKILSYIHIIYPILKAELFLHWSCNEIEGEIDKLINELLRQNLITLVNNKLYINPLRFDTFRLLASGIRDTLQRYAVTFWILSINPYISRTMLEIKNQQLIYKLSTMHNINAPEFFEKTIFSRLVLTLRKEGYIRNFPDIQAKKSTMKVYQMLATLITSDVRLTIENTSNNN